MKHTMTKTYGAEQGLSCCFRQWRATSHCNQLHGYAIAVTLKFGAQELDGRNWVVDFGALKSVKEFLQENFDHTTLIAADDPALGFFQNMFSQHLCDLRVLENGVGCERFAEFIANHIRAVWLPRYVRQVVDAGIKPPQGLALLCVEVREHGANAASYLPSYRWQGMEGSALNGPEHGQA